MQSNIFRLRDGQIVEPWGRLDDLGLLRQLGVSDQLPRNRQRRSGSVAQFRMALDAGYLDTKLDEGSRY